ncbi:hypothetical protein [Peterkaempfera bronchialis]|uniref:HD domain-containing protein n=1 Tax=Peterkaempfera bronchialis TaxID=2126346 RepID=A0A345SZ04_9ACTN|nr:hypothetical protein [Peterkaempfera bronchialis]AXI78959.1 hypothetical protein C7M71_017610 [Peterkaempfera bronchialis]
MSTTPTTASLVELAARRQLPHHQYMDPATVQWIRDNRPDLGHAWPPPLRPASKHLLGRSALPAAWLAEPRLRTSLHGIRHSMRTAALAALLAETHDLDEVETATVILAAALHDCRRLHDKDDQGHGARAAVWLSANADTVWDHFGLVITPRRIVQAATAIRLHDLPYDAFNADDRADHGRAELICDLVKAADALDRYRLPTLRWWPDARHVREHAFDQLRAVAFDLVVISETAHLAGADSAEAVLYALAEKGLV